MRGLDDQHVHKPKKEIVFLAERSGLLIVWKDDFTGDQGRPDAD